MQQKPSGAFIVIEGIEYAGKTTQAHALVKALQSRNYDAFYTREPGGSAIGEQIRTILKNPSYKDVMDPLTSLLLFNAARRQFLKEVVRPALTAGKIVVTDRFDVSTRAYQGYAEGLPLHLVDQICQIATDGIVPAKVFLLDITLKEMEQRRLKRGGASFDRYDQMDASFHARVRHGYLSEQQKHPDHIELIDGARTQGVIAEDLLSRTLALFTS